MWQVDWALQHHAQYCYQKIMDESWKPLTPLPEPLDQADLAAPPAPTMLLLTINKRDSSLKFPERVLARWHDHADLGAAFREKYAECKASHPLDLPNAKRETEDTDGNKGPAPKKLRRGTPIGSDTELTVTESSWVDVADMKPLHRKAAIVTCPKLHVEVCVGNAVYLTNHTDEPLTLKDGTTIAGFFKGKFWSDAAQKGKEDQNLEAGPSDVAFSLKASSDRVQLGSKLMLLGSLVRAKRDVAPADAIVAYHSIVDQPTQDDPAAFRLESKGYTIFWRTEDLKAKTAKSEGVGDELTIPAPHLAGTIPSSKWLASAAVDVVWAVKWPAVAAKGLQPVRPAVVLNFGSESGQMCVCVCACAIFKFCKSCVIWFRYFGLH